MSDSFQRAQAAYDAMTPEDPEWIEPTDEHEEMAIAELDEDLERIWECLEASPFRTEFASFLFRHCEDFRETVLRENERWIAKRKQEIADIEHKHQADEWATRYL